VNKTKLEDMQLSFPEPLRIGKLIPTDVHLKTSSIRLLIWQMSWVWPEQG